MANKLYGGNLLPIYERSVMGQTKGLARPSTLSGL